MPAASIATRTSVASHVKALAQGRRPAAKILLNGLDEAAIPTFTTLDKIEGEVVLTANQDCRFDGLEISFEGYVKTYVENLAVAAAANSRQTAYHRFLKLTQPIDEADLPQPRVAEAGRTHRFPFTFVVPGQLLPHACTHKFRNNQVHDAHLQLPPSMGDQTVSGNGSALDDLAPAMSKIHYVIRVHVSKELDQTDKTVTLLETTRKVRIMPTSDEAPPLSIDAKTEDYVLRKEKGLKKGVFKGKLGRLSIEAAQPTSLRLAPSSVAAPAPTTTVATVNLRFDPADEQAQPPKLQQLTSKLHAITYFGARPMNDFPSRAATIYDSAQGHYETSVSLSARCVEKAEWTRHAPDNERRDSAYSSMSSSSSDFHSAPSKSYIGKSYYTAQVIVPITLPKNRAWIPTFHSCLVARIYTLDLTLSTSSTSPSPSALKLTLPVQISAAPSLTSAPLLNPNEAAPDIDGFFAPRTISVPNNEFLQRGSLADIQALATVAPVVAQQPEVQQQQTPQVPVARPGQLRAPPPGYSAFVSGRPVSQVPQVSRIALAMTPGCG
ncbi:MAG: hypothetical protein M1814_001113 [Vezdaea aestivalis]|nr:MAG: hypothetical protein M1814_001113 [Vezdaea aestivalis]